MPAPGEITKLLALWCNGEAEALNRLIPRIEPELRRVARRFFARERRPNHTLQPTALVNEVFLRLVRQRVVNLESRTQFLAACATQMQRILVDHERRRRAIKRGGESTLIVLTVEPEGDRESGIELLELHQALQELKRCHPRPHEIVRLRFFGGLTIREVAAWLGVSAATVKADSAIARAFLFRELRGEHHDVEV